MPSEWTFGDPHDDDKSYADGTVVPSRRWAVYLNGVEVGEVEVHMHKRQGRDKVTDASFGFTGVIFGPLTTTGN